MEDLGRYLWNFVIMFLNAMESIWQWLITPKDIAKLEIFGVTLFNGMTLTPLALTGGVILIILGLGLISLVNPFN